MDSKVIELVKQSGYKDVAALLAFIEVETGGKGFDEKTGKILIQFEPSWFRKKAPYAPSGLWSVNKVDVQCKEWEAFNNAFKKDKEAAMESTSIGLGQIMGFNYTSLGYVSVGDMWDDAKKGLDRQIYQIIQFIKSNKNLQNALNERNWDKVACIYNGSGYKELAKRIPREPYNVSLDKAFKKYSSL